MKSYKYETVIRYITDNYIDNGNFVLGKLPSEPELAKEMKISRYPVNQAYNILVEQGKLTKISGLGTFIRGQEPKDYLFKTTSLKSTGLICETGSLAPAMQEGIHDELLQNSIAMTNIITGNPKSDESTLARVRELKLQSVFFIPRLYFGEGENPAVKFVRQLEGLGVLPIIIERPLKGYNGLQVLVDNAGGSAMAVDWMINDGRREIAYIGKDDYVVGRERYNGYLNALRNEGIEPDDSLVALDSSNGKFQFIWEKFVEKSMDRIMERHPDCKSFVAFSVDIAYFIYSYLKKHGKFNDQVRIAAYESFSHYDHDFRKCYICLERPLYNIGKEAAALAAGHLSGKSSERYVVKKIPPEMHFYKNDNYLTNLY